MGEWSVAWHRGRTDESLELSKVADGQATRVVTCHQPWERLHHCGHSQCLMKELEGTS